MLLIDLFPRILWGWMPKLRKWTWRARCVVTERKNAHIGVWGVGIWVAGFGGAVADVEQLGDPCIRRGLVSKQTFDVGCGINATLCYPAPTAATPTAMWDVTVAS